MLIEDLASMGHNYLWKLICAISVSNILTVGVHLSSTPSISGPGSATEAASGKRKTAKGFHFKLSLLSRGGFQQKFAKVDKKFQTFISNDPDFFTSTQQSFSYGDDLPGLNQY